MKHGLLGVLVDAIDYDAAVDRVLAAAAGPSPMAASALAVHGVVEAWRDPQLRARVNRLDLVTPDGQPVRWALNLLHRTGLRDRVYGPTLTRRILEAAPDLPVFLYGSTPAVLSTLADRLGANVVGSRPSLFRPAGPGELDAIAAEIRASGARLVLVGLGCPRQERFVSAMRDRVGVPLLAVGAAFDYLAGLRREPPTSIQRLGLQWLWRLMSEPRRLWRRYLILNPVYVALVAAQALRLRRFPPDEPIPTADEPVPA